MSQSNTKKPIRVCFVSPKAYPLFNPEVEGVIGGAEVDLYLLATELAKDENFHVTCITADYDQMPEEKIENVTIIKSLNFKQNPITGAVKIYKAMKKANADIYIIKTASPGVPLAAVFCKLHKKVFIYRTAHQRECDGTYVKKHFFLGIAFAKSLRFAKIIFAQNEDDSKKLKATLGLNSTVIPNGHRIPDLTEANKKTILWVGRSAQAKRPELFLELAKRIDAPFTMICQRATGDNNYQELVEKANQTENLTFIEQVQFAQIDSYFRDAKVLVNTSDSEGFPNTFIQAAKAATAILSLNVNPDDFLEKHNCGIACNGDIDQLDDSLKLMLKGDNFNRFGSDGRDYAGQTHDITKIIKIYKSIFENEVLCQ